MPSEKNDNPFDDSNNTILYTKMEDNNPLAEIMGRMNGLSLSAFSPKKDESLHNDSNADFSNLSEMSINEEASKTENNKNGDLVYLQYFAETVQNLKKSFRKLVRNKFVHKELVTQIFEKLQNDDLEGATSLLRKILDKKTLKEINIHQINHFLQVIFPMVLKEINENLEKLSLLKKDIFDFNKSILTFCIENKNQVKSIQDDTKSKIKKFKNDISDIFGLTEEHSIDQFFNELLDKIRRIYNENKNIKQENKHLKESSDIKDLKKEIEDKKNDIKQLQSQNISFSEVITKLDTTNIKLKKECIILSNEYKKLVDSLKSKNTIIEKQKRILEVLQKQVGGKENIVIDDLKRKIERLKHKIENEKSQEKINKLQMELTKYDQRIKDLEAIYKT